MSKLAVNESVVNNRKRKRANGTNPNAKPEMKRWNPFHIVSTEDFQAIQIGNGYTSTSGDAPPSYGYFAWHPILLRKPSQGSSAFNRIGEDYFCRFLRFKGYIEIKKYPVYQMHYRLRLVRCAGGTTLSEPLDYLTNFKNVELDVSDVEKTYASFRHNFFKKVRDVDSKLDTRITNICSGVLPTAPSTKTVTLTAGSSSSYSNAFNRGITPWGGLQCIPIDVKVDVNDRINDDINYYLILEDDFPTGFINNAPTGASEDPVVLSQSWSNFPIIFNFFCTGYFTDD